MGENLKHFFKFLLVVFCTLLLFAPVYADYAWKYPSLVGPYSYDSNLLSHTSADETTNTYTIKTTQTTSSRGLYLNKQITLPANHKYFMKVKLKSNYTNQPYLLFPINGGYDNLNLSNYQKNEWSTGAKIVVPTQDWQPTGSNFGILPVNNNIIEGETITVEKDGFVVIFDLTELFGAGNEPATVAAAEQLLLDIPQIKIATTKYLDTEFAPLKTNLTNAIAIVNTVVTNTISQAEQIGELQTQKQTRPADDSECPAGKQCLLVTDTSGAPHWYEIFDPFYNFLAPIVQNNANSNTTGGTGDGRYYYYDKTSCEAYGGCPSGNNVWLRQFSTTGGIYRTLTENEWAVEWAENNSDDNILPGVVYGVAKCSKYHTVTILTPEQAANTPEWNDTPTDATDAANYKYCWCRMTGIGFDNMLYSTTSEKNWVYNTSGLNNCFNDCVRRCTNRVADTNTVRKNIFGL